MAKPSTYVFRVAFIGLPEEFRRAHRVQLEALGAECIWVNKTELLPAKTLFHALVLNLDSEKNALGEIVETMARQHSVGELIGISSRGSVPFAMECLRQGFSDFLTPPVSPDELALCLLRCKQRQDPSNKGALAASFMGKALMQISGASSLEMVHLRTASILAPLLRAKRVYWSNSRKREVTPAKQNMVLLCHQPGNGRFIIQGFSRALSRSKMNQAKAIVGHAELAMMNLRQVEKLKRQTFVDDLTGLYNYRYLKFALQSAAKEYETKQEPFSLLFIDVDHFKQVNDRNGHLVGSDFLAALGRIFKNAVRNGDSVFRYGGDEFVILLRKAGVSRGAEIAERLRLQTASRAFSVRGVALKATVSIGMATYPDHARQVDQLVQLADAAMYEAKKKRNAVQSASAPKPRRRPNKPLQPAL